MKSLKKEVPKKRVKLRLEPSLVAEILAIAAERDKNYQTLVRE